MAFLRHALVPVLTLVLAVLPPTVPARAAFSIGETRLISRDSRGLAGGGGEPQISASGKIVVFSSSGALVAGDTDGLDDIYLRDGRSSLTTRISGGLAPARRPAISADGLVVAYDSPAAGVITDTNALQDIYVFDVKNQRTLLISLGFAGSAANGGSFSPAVSADGRFVAFDSNAADLVAGDTNASADVFIADLAAGKIERVSLGSGGAQANGPSYEPAVSADGRFVAFHSDAANLVPADTNGVSDVFVHDRLTAVTRRISVSSSAAQANGGSYGASISADGRAVAFDSNAANLTAGDTNRLADVFVHDLLSGLTTIVSRAADNVPAGGPSYRPALSADGRVVAFTSRAANLVAGDGNQQDDVFLHDLQTGDVTRVSVPDAGGQANGTSSDVALAADGSSAAFVSTAGNLVAGDGNAVADIFVHQLRLAPPPVGDATRVSVSSSGTQANGHSNRAAISADGQVIAFDSAADNLVNGDTNGQVDVFVRDLTTQTTSRISLATGGGQAYGGSYSPAVSADGQIVAFDSNAANLVSGDSNGAADVFVHDRRSGVTERVSVSSSGLQGNNGSYAPSISGNGRFVAFHSIATNLVADDRNGTYDVFVHDRLTHQTWLISRATDGTPGNAGSYSAALSGDGSVVAFDSNAANLVKDDTNGSADVFVHRLTDAVTERVSLSYLGTQGNHGSLEPSISADGNLIAFKSQATNLVEADSNGNTDVFVHDRLTGSTKRASVATGGLQSNGDSQSAALSRDGRYVAFTSDADNLARFDTNATSDVFLYDREAAVTTRISVTTDGSQSNSWSGTPSVADNANLVVFEAAAANLSSDDSNGLIDIFLRDAAPKTAFVPVQLLQRLFLPFVTQ